MQVCNIVKKEFTQWLEGGHAKRHSPEICIICLERTSEYILSKGIIDKPICNIINHKEFSKVHTRLLREKKFYQFDKRNCRIFEHVGYPYSKFLLEKERQLYNICGTVTKGKEDQVDNTRKNSLAKERTIAGAIFEVLTQKQPLTISQIYQEILARDLYVFGAVNPENVVAVTIKRHCKNLDYSRSEQHTDLFKAVGLEKNKQLFALINYGSIEGVNNLKWSDSIRHSFFDWLIMQGKAESTARSYCNSMNWNISNYSREWIIARNQSSTLSGIKLFFQLIADDDSFISANQTAHNQYSAALKAFTEFLKNADGIESKNIDVQIEKTAEKPKKIEWTTNEKLYGTKPIFIKYLDAEKTIKVLSWKDVLLNLFEYMVVRFPNKDFLKGNGLYNGSRILCSYNESDLFYASKISNGLFVETNHSSSRIIKICKMFLEFCGADLSSIEIQYCSADSQSKLSKIERKQKEAEMNTDYGNADLQATAVLELVKANFDNGIRLDGIDLEKLKNLLQKTEFESINDEELEDILKHNLYEVDRVYYHLNSLLCNVNIDEIKAQLFNEFENGYQRIYTCRLREFYGNRIASIVSPLILGRIINWQTGYQIRHNENSGFLWIKSCVDKADVEVQKAVLRVLKDSNGLTKEEIVQELKFYDIGRINWILEKTDKAQKKKDSWEWKEMFRCDDKYYHVEIMYFTEAEIGEFKKTGLNMQKDKGLQEQASTILDVAKYLLDNYNEVKADDAAKLIKIAESLTPNEKIDITALYKTLFHNNVAGIPGLTVEYGEAAVRKALEYYLIKKNENALDVSDSGTDAEEEVDNV